MVQDHYITLEVCHHLGNFLGALPSGQITDPAQTEKSSEVAQFAPFVIVSSVNKLTFVNHHIPDFFHPCSV